MDEHLEYITTEVCTERRAHIIELDTMPDHIHLLDSVGPPYGIYRLVIQIKGRLHRLLRQKFPELKSNLPTLWTNSYFVATLGGATLEVVKKYVQNQRNL